MTTRRQQAEAPPWTTRRRGSRSGRHDDQAAAPHARADPRAIRLEDAAPFLRLLFEAIWRHCFVYRDINDLLSRHRPLELGLQAIVEHKAQVAGLLCRVLREAGELTAGPEDVPELTTNMVVVATGWLPFEYIAHARRFGDPGFQAASTGRAVAQMLALLRPWLTEAGRERIAGAAGGAPTAAARPSGFDPVASSVEPGT